MLFSYALAVVDVPLVGLGDFPGLFWRRRSFPRTVAGPLPHAGGVLRGSPQGSIAS